MRVINDFKCSDGHITEHFVDSMTTVVRCACGKDATKSRSKVNAYFNPHGNNATTKAKLRWAKQRERTIAYERKTNADD